MTGGVSRPINTCRSCASGFVLVRCVPVRSLRSEGQLIPDRPFAVLAAKGCSEPEGHTLNFIQLAASAALQTYGVRCGRSVSSVMQLVFGKEIAVEIMVEMSSSWIIRARSLFFSVTDGVLTKPG
jgi:hypothetical protein